MATAVRPEVRGDRRDRYRARQYLMCPPEHFEVAYRINPWMRPPGGSPARAMAEWERLVAVLGDLGHRVVLADPIPGAPDMVFAANAGLVVGGRVLAARFRHPQRRVEEGAWQGWFRAAGYRWVEPSHHRSEGEGDLLVAGPLLLAGHGFRTERAAHDEAARFSGREVVSLELVDPRFYHLDLAVCVLDDDLVAWYPGALSPHSRQVLRRRFPDAIEVTGDEAARFALNSVSDGYHVVHPAGSERFAARLREQGFSPVPVPMAELARAGGAAKCCVLELRGGAQP